jgi:hypothetical protein
MKTCNTCKVDKEDWAFSKNKKHCKECAAISFKKWSEKKKLEPKPPLPDSKKCSVCNVIFPIVEFYIRSDRNKPIARCRKCNQKVSTDSWNKLTETERKHRFSENKKWRDSQIKNGNLKVTFTDKLCRYKGISKKKNLPFDLTTDYLIELFESQDKKCYYTGKELTLHSTRGDGHQIFKLGKYHYQASLDRLIPERGYIKGNVVWCGWLVNTCKNLLTEQELYALCDTILTNKFKKQD